MERRDATKQASRRSFVKAGLAGGAVVAGAALLKAAPMVSAVAPAQGYPQYASYLVWLDGDLAKFRKTNLKSGVVEGTPNIDAATVVQEAINALPPNDANDNSVGGEIWLSTDINDTDAVITIDRSNVSLLAMRKTGPRVSNLARPHLMKILYTGKVRGGVLRGLNCRQITFDGTGNQQQMSLEDISLHPNGSNQGLQFLGTGVAYQQYINIHNLEIALDGADAIGIEFKNSNNGTGHIDFSGHTIIATEAGATGSPVGIQFSTGVQTGTPIRFDNLSISDQGRTAGAALKPIYMQTQPSGVDHGLRQLNIKHLYFQQKYTSPNDLFTIDSSTGTAWFIATVDELSISDDSARVVNIVKNMNTQWMTREQLLRINSGFKLGADPGGLALGVPNQHTFFRVYLGKVSPLTPFGRLVNPFKSATNQEFVGAGGDSANPLAGTTYRVGPTPVAISGPGLTIKDPAGNVVKTVSTATGEPIPTGYLVAFTQTTGYTVYGT